MSEFSRWLKESKKSLQDLTSYEVYTPEMEEEREGRSGKVGEEGGCKGTGNGGERKGLKGGEEIEIGTQQGLRMNEGVSTGGEIRGGWVHRGREERAR
eukprot:648251-Amorphochlora_amoeboformis.AAC.1